ncbi:MAG: efflux RND transporter permease subunit [Candidatus Eisenbacteria bacterium]
MFLSDISVRRPVFTTMLVLAFVVLGIFGYYRLAVDLMPDVDFPFVTITTIYPGAGPKETESQITKPIEDAVSTIANIDLMESVSREGVSFVMMRFKLEADPDVAANDVRAKVDGILQQLPAGIQKPQVQKFEFGAMPIISLSVSSGQGVNQTYAFADRAMRDRLSQVSGVATVDIIGGQRREIQVAVDRKRLEYYGLPITMVTAAIASENLNIPEGRIVQGEKEYILRTVGEFPNIEEIGNVQIPLPTGSFVSLRDVAEIRDSFAERRSVARFNGQLAVQLDIVKRARANTISTADGIYKAVEQLRRELPPGFVIEYAQDSSIFIRDSVKDVQSSILIGIVLTSILLFAFLKSLRGTVIVAVVMPASIVSTFLLMQASNFTLNILTLMALGVSVGVLVTNAIVVLENILRHLAMGKSPKDASIEGTNEVAIAVLASVLTNLVVFVPVAFMKGIIGRFFLQFGLTVVYATIFSLFISFTLTPMLAAAVLKRLGKGKPDVGVEPSAGSTPGNTAPYESKWWMDRVMQRLSISYRDLLGWTTARGRNFVILIVATFACLVGGVALVAISGGEFMPRMDESFVSVSLALPAGSSLAMTEKAVGEIETILRAEPDVISALSTIGGSDRGVNEAAIMAKLVPITKRSRSAYQISNDLRPKLSGIPGADIAVTSEAQDGGSSADLEIEVMGDDLDQLKKVSAEVLGIVGATPGLVDVETSWKEGGEELVFRPDRDELSRRGLSTGAVAALLRNSFEGDDNSVFREAGEEYRIRVQFTDADRQDVRTFEGIRVQGSSAIPLTQIGSIEKQRGEAEILRRERQRRITVRANIARGTISEAVRQIKQKTDVLQLPSGYKVKFAGMYEFQQESFASLYQALLLAIILTYVVLAMTIESFFHPIMIMITLPLGLIGSAIGLFFGGQTINIVSLMAIIMLVGIVVNNAILLLDYVGQMRKRGLKLKDAVLEGCPTRLRAIIMTNLAIAVGMIPQVMSRASGFEMRTAMGFVTMGGVLVSAFFTLVLIPSMYYFFERAWARFRGREA